FTYMADIEVPDMACDITYEISGDESGPIIETFTSYGEEGFVMQSSMTTASGEVEPSGKVTEVTCYGNTKRPPTRLRQVPGRGLSSVRDSTPMMSGSAYQRAAFTATSGALLAYLHLVGTVLTADRGVQLGVSLRRDLLQLVEVALRLLLSVRRG